MNKADTITTLQHQIVRSFVDDHQAPQLIADRMGVSLPDVYDAIREVIRLSWTVTPPAIPKAPKPPSPLLNRVQS